MVETAPHEHKITLFIDEEQYHTASRRLTGEQIRHLPTPPIGPDRDLWLEVPGNHDRLIQNHEEVDLHDGVRFFTAPATINPGMNAGSN